MTCLWICPLEVVSLLPFMAKLKMFFSSLLPVLPSGKCLSLIKSLFPGSQFSSVELLSRVWLLVTPWTATCQASLSFTNSGACSKSCPSSWWCHPTISSSVIPFSSCLQSFPASGSFLMSRLFASGGQSIGASASVLQWIFRIDFPIRIYKVPVLSAQGTLKSLFQHQSSKASIL